MYRSLTTDELALQTIFDHHFGRCGPLVSDPLCETLPDISPSLIDLPRKAAKVLVERFTPALEALNAQIYKDQRYQVNPPSLWTREENRNSTITLSHEQMHAVAKRLAKELKRSDKP